MSRFASSGVLAAAILSLGLIGCGSEEAETEPETVEFLTFWGKGGELEALDALIDVHTARRPNATVTKSIEEDSASYTTRLTERMNQRNPPDTFQSNQGTRLTRWVLFNDTDATQSKFEPVTSLSDEERGNIHEALLNVNSFGGDLYAVPVGIIRQNSFYYNPTILEDHDISVDSLMQPGKAGVEALLSACETLAAADINCLAMGNKNIWILDMFLWENLFPAMVGKDYYTAFWKGEKDPDTDVELEETLNMMLELYKYIDPDNTEIDFDASLERLWAPEGDPTRCAMVQMGDWGTGMYKAMEEKIPEAANVGVMMFPGMANTFMFSSDVVPISKGTANTKAAQEFLKTIATAEAQTAFNFHKGSLPARKDADITQLSLSQQAASEHLNAATTDVVPVVHGLKPDTIMGDLGNKAAEMVATGDIEVVRSYIAAHYQELKNYADLGR